MTSQLAGDRGLQHEVPWGNDAAAVADALGSDLTAGLSSSAAERLRALGPNTLPTAMGPSVWSLVERQLRETMILVLLGAALLTSAIGDFADTFVIALVVVLNTSLGVVQDVRARRAISALSSLTAHSARAIRSGTTEVVAAADVVVGDLLELEAGDRVPADGRVVEAQGLQVDEATLTGESLPVLKDRVPCEKDSAVADRHCMLHAGTAVTGGRGRILVTATGSSTEVGRVATLLATTSAPATPLQRRLTSFGHQVAAAAAAVCVLVLALGLTQGQPFERMVLVAISLAVAAVPESLPAAVVLSLATAAGRMARRSVVVRTLPAVEALGAVTTIASDKTGTLTQGLMTVPELWTPAGRVTATGDGYSPVGQVHGTEAAVTAVGTLTAALALCNDAEVLADHGGWVVAGDPLEGALFAVAARRGHRVGDLRRRNPRVATYAFDAQRMRMTTVHRTDEGQFLVICKGAPDVVLELLDLSAEQRAAAALELSSMTKRGLRVLGVAQCSRDRRPADVGEAERGLELVGLVALHDPPRQAAARAVLDCRRAGIVPVMITGDHPETAAAIARELGILDDDGLVVTGSDVRTRLDELDLTRVRVFARTAPEQKLAIVQALRRAGQVVAMTGDGVNDAPALRAADVGVAMGRSGTEVARQAADIVLVDDDLSSLVAAVSEGRRVYDNVRRFLLYALSGGVAEVLIMLTGPVFGLTLPLLPAQILWVNMLTHGLPGVALGAEHAEPDVLRRPPRRPEQGVLGDGLLRRVLALGALVALATLALGTWAESTGREWQSMVFVTLTLSQLGVALTLRARRAGLTDNPLLLVSVGVNAFLLWLALAWSPLSGVLGTHALPLTDLGRCVLVALVAPAAVALCRRAAR